MLTHCGGPLNYSGRFDASTSSLGPGHLLSGGQVETVHPTQVAGAIIVPDAHLLFNADFRRSGLDLILSKDDRELVLPDYFKGEVRAALATSDGAHLSGALVSALTGQVECAQAGCLRDATKAIGQ